jgi:hypothetical protein
MYINVLIKYPNKNPIIKKIRNELDRLNKILGGNFDLLEYDKNSFIAYNYKSKNKEQIQIGNHFLNGTIIVLGNDLKEGDFMGLSKEQIRDFTKEFSIHNTNFIQERESGENEI